MPGRSPASAWPCPPTIDGALTDRAWDLGAAAEEFWMSARQKAPADQTRVVVVYDDIALYIAFTCKDDRPELIRASQVTRDAPPGLDDR